MTTAPPVVASGAQPPAVGDAPAKPATAAVNPTEADGAREASGVE
ncbi:hypothetical protein [Propioniciclava tarda]|nr:hypothetical protein [Propioniciclava tarda]